MIVTTIMGGLGNQLFQYAAGRTVALRTGRRLVLDATPMPTPFDGGLRAFGLPELPIAPVRIIRRPGRAGRELAPSVNALRIRNLARGLLRARAVIEPETHDELVDLTDPPGPICALIGYWQSHRYFVGAEDVLRAELTPPVPTGSAVASVLDRLAGQDIIALHVRRGDYVSRPDVAGRIGALPIEYFRRGAEVVAASCDRPAFAVLSDDPDWTAEHLRLDAPMLHVEADRRLAPLEVLGLMSRAEHAVIANSSLSWWGAWLAEHPGQRVVAPSQWFASRPIDPAHRFPAAWTAI